MGTRRFIKGSEESPVSSACICGDKSLKHSSIVSNPENAPKSEKCGVQICAGINTASGHTSSVIESRSLDERLKIGRPSERILPIVSNLKESRSAASSDGRRMTLCTLRTFPSCFICN